MKFWEFKIEKGTHISICNRFNQSAWLGKNGLPNTWIFSKMNEKEIVQILKFYFKINDRRKRQTHVGNSNKINIWFVPSRMTWVGTFMMDSWKNLCWRSDSSGLVSRSFWEYTWWISVSESSRWEEAARDSLMNFSRSCNTRTATNSTTCIYLKGVCNCNIYN